MAKRTVKPADPKPKKTAVKKVEKAKAKSKPKAKAAPKKTVKRGTKTARGDAAGVPAERAGTDGGITGSDAPPRPAADKPLYTEEELALIREKQLELAFGGDRQMLIWLGKALLGQKPPDARGTGESADWPAVIVLTPEEAAALYGKR